MPRGGPEDRQTDDPQTTQTDSMCTHDRPHPSRIVRLARRLCPHPRVTHELDCLGGPGYGHTECELCGEHTAHWTLPTHPDPEQRFDPREREPQDKYQ